MKNSQALLHFCSKTFYCSKPTSTLHCDLLSNQSYQPLVTSTIFLQIYFFLQMEVPNTHTHTLQTPFLFQIESPNTWKRRKNIKKKEMEKGKQNNKKKNKKKQ